MTDTAEAPPAPVEAPPATPAPAETPPQAPAATAPEPAPIVQPEAPQPAQPEAAQTVPPEAADAPVARPAAPTLRFPGTTDRPPQLGIEGTPAEATATQSAPTPPAPAPDATPAAAPETTPGGDVQVALVQADFNGAITDEMARLAMERARALGATVVQHVHVAGAFDLPLTVQTLARRDGIDAVVALGCVIQGETGHDLTITEAAATQLARVACDEETPVGFGVIGPRMTKEQAEARVSVGANAMESAVRQVRTLRQIADPAQVDQAQYVAQGH